MVYTDLIDLHTDLPASPALDIPDVFVGVCGHSGAIVQLHKFKLPQLTALYSAADAPKLLTISVVMAHKNALTASAHPLRELLRLIHIVAKRLFYEHVLARLHCLARKFYVGIMRHDYDDKVSVQFQRLVIVRKAD